ncbi:MAG: glycosyltransferase [Planctomycetota bacterium]
MSERKRLLILSASAGAGHVRAAEALAAACLERHSEIQVHHEDALDHVSRLVKRTYARGYLQTVNRSPALWGYLYQVSDKQDPAKSKGARLVHLLDQLGKRKLVRLVQQVKPFHVLCTHFLPARDLLVRKAAHPERPPVSVVITDYDVHAYWVDPGVHRYYVASEEVRWELAARGIAPERIVVAGIPIHPVFKKPQARGQLATRHGVATDIRTVLVLSGGFGVGDVERTVKTVLEAEGPLQVLAVSGRNEALRKTLSALPVPPGKVLKVFGFVDFMEELMELADLCVSKSGGLTVSECLAKGLPMIVLAPIPGQEERNCDYLLERSIAVKAKDHAGLAYKLRGLLADPERLPAMRVAARAASRASAAFDIIEDVLYPSQPEPRP